MQVGGWVHVHKQHSHACACAWGEWVHLSVSARTHACEAGGGSAGSTYMGEGQSGGGGGAGRLAPPKRWGGCTAVASIEQAKLNACCSSTPTLALNRLPANHCSVLLVVQG